MTLSNRQLKALRTKKSLYESAMELFLKKGYDNVTIEEIASRAGTSVGSFYTYFKTKGHVFLEQFREYDEQYFRIYESMPDCATARGKLMWLIKGVYVFASEKVGLETIKLLYTHGFMHGGDGTSSSVEETRSSNRIVGEIVHEGWENGEFRTDIPEQEMTRMVFLCMMGTYYHWCSCNGKYDLVESGERLLTVFLDGITAGGASDVGANDVDV